jgi:hypothetical protein
LQTSKLPILAPLVIAHFEWAKNELLLFFDKYLKLTHRPIELGAMQQCWDDGLNSASIGKRGEFAA